MFWQIPYEDRNAFFFLRCFMKLNLLTLLLIAVLSGGCSTQQVNTPNTDMHFTNIAININGATNKLRPGMVNICKGFILSKQQVINFLTYATHVNWSLYDKSYDILPCYSSGHITLNNRRYSWVIRSGGIGELHSKRDKFIKVCGKLCCTKVKGIC